MTDQQAFYTLLTALAGMVPNFQLTKQMIATYDRLLSPLGYAKVNGALDKIIIERSSRDPFPSVAEVMEKIDPKLKPEQESVIAANLIMEALAKHGPYQVAPARTHVGPLGWRVVEMSGGWANLCESVDYKTMGMHKAQWTKLAEALLASPQLGSGTAHIADNRVSEGQLKGFGEFMKQLTEFQAGGESEKG